MAEAAPAPPPRPPRFFCHSCRIEFDEVLAEYKCPYCFQGFIEQVEAVRMPIPTVDNAEGQGNRPVTTGQYSDIGIDELDEPPPENVCSDRWANWSPPWNYRDENTPPSSNNSPTLGNDLAFLMTDDRINGAMRIGSAESLLQQIMWQVTGGRAGNQSLLFVGSDPNDYVMSSEGLDAIMSQLLWNSDNDGPPPLAQEIIENLPEVTISEEQVFSKLQCSVCWEIYNLDEKVRQLKCGHLYHQSCISPWLQLHATCPICRQSLAPPENTESEQRSRGSREPSANNPQPSATQYPIVPPNLASIFLRACAPLAGPISQGANVRGMPTNTLPRHPSTNTAGSFRLPQDDDPEEDTDVSEDTATNDNVTPATANEPTNPTSQGPTNTRRHIASFSPGHIVLMSSTPRGPLESNSLTDYITIWSSGPISSSTVSSTTSDTIRTNLDMDLD